MKYFQWQNRAGQKAPGLLKIDADTLFGSNGAVYFSAGTTVDGISE